MNKLEFLEKMEEVDALIADGKYDLAVEICDTLNLSGVKEPRRLQNIAKAYERCRRYKEAEVLLLHLLQLSTLHFSLVISRWRRAWRRT